MSEAPRRRQIDSIQALRAIAAIGVVVFHGLLTTEKYGGGSTLGDWLEFGPFGQSGVDLFFVISGFIMVYVSKRHFGQPGATTRFLQRRIIRVVPVYWFWTSVMVAINVFVRHADIAAWHTIASYLFLPATSPGGSRFPVLYVGWTLQYEVYFYVLFAVFLAAPRRWFLPGLTVWMVGSAAASAFVTDPSPMVEMLIDPLLLEFLAGCWIAAIYQREAVPGRALGWGLAALGAAGFGATIVTGIDLDQRWWAWGIPSALTLAGIVAVEWNGGLRVPRFLSALGDSSYSLYLCHLLPAPLLGKVWRRLGLDEALPGEGLVLLILAVSLVLGHISFLVIERPVTDFLNGKFSKKRGEASAGAS